MNDNTIMIAASIGCVICLVLYLQRRRARKMREMRGK